MVISRPKIGVSTENERRVSLERVRERQRSIERGQRLLDLQNEFESEGIPFRSSLPVGASEREVIRNLEQQLEQRREQRVQRPRFDRVQSQGRAPLGRQIEAGLFGATALVSPLLATGAIIGETIGPAAAGLIVNPEETIEQARSEAGGGVFDLPTRLATAAFKTAPGPATAGQVAGGITGGLGAVAPRQVDRAARLVGRQFQAPKEAGLVASDPVATSITRKLTGILSEARPARESVEVRRGLVRSEQARNIAGIQADRTITPGQAVVRSRSVTRGELPFGEFDIGEQALSADELIILRNAIRFSDDLKPFDKTNLDFSLLRVLGAVDEEGGAVARITGKGRLPARGEIDRLGAFFGDDFAKAILKHRGVREKLYDEFIDAVNLPRTMLASFGIDALRQGAPLIAAHPRSSFRAFNAAWRAARNQSVARKILADLERDGDVALLQANGLELTRFGRTASQVSREEGFVSRWGQIFPWVRVSERANTAFFNTLRADIGKGILREWREADRIAKQAGVASRSMEPGNLKSLARFINIASGRGNLGPLQRQSPLLNALFFSPRLIASRFQLPFTALTRSHAVRKQIVRDLAIFATTNIGILAFIKAAGGDKVDVELDPRSSDFGQLKIGPQRVDFWGGLRQVAVLAARLASGETKTTGSETILTQEAMSTLLQFFRFKLSPQASVITDFITDETALGEEIGVDNQIADRFFPLVIEDMKEAFEVQGLGGAAISSFSLVGLNSNTFLTTQDIVNPLLETTINVQAQDGTGRITEITDPRLTPVQRSQILSRPDVQEALLAESRRTKEDQLQIERNARRAMRLTNDFRLQNGEIDGAMWRDQLLTARLINAEVSRTRQTLTGGRPVSRPRNDGERALNQYFEIVDAHRVQAADIDITSFDPSELTPDQRAVIARGFDLQGFSDEIDRFLGSLPDEQRRFVLDNIHADRTPVENLYYDAQEILKDYWSAPDRVIQSANLRALYDQWRSLPGNARREFERRNPEVQRAVEAVSRFRERLRKRSRAVDDMLIAFYGGSPSHVANRRESQNGLLISRTRARIFDSAEERLQRLTRVVSNEAI